MSKASVLTGSFDDLRATREHAFHVIGVQQRRHGMPGQIEPESALLPHVAALLTRMRAAWAKLDDG